MMVGIKRMVVGEKKDNGENKKGVWEDDKMDGNESKGDSENNNSEGKKN
jgi:hypothetical protein